MRRRRATVPVATPGEWAYGGSQVANGPNIFQLLLVHTSPVFLGRILNRRILAPTGKYS